TGPALCLGVFGAALVVTHLPGIYDAALRHPALHDGEHVLYLLAGSLVWFPILGGDPLPSRRLGGLAMLGYLLATMVPMALVGAGGRRRRAGGAVADRRGRAALTGCQYPRRHRAVALTRGGAGKASRRARARGSDQGVPLESGATGAGIQPVRAGLLVLPRDR